MWTAEAATRCGLTPRIAKIRAETCWQLAWCKPTGLYLSTRRSCLLLMVEDDRTDRHRADGGGAVGSVHLDPGSVHLDPMGLPPRADARMAAPYGGGRGGARRCPRRCGGLWGGGGGGGGAASCP